MVYLNHNNETKSKTKNETTMKITVKNITNTLKDLLFNHVGNGFAHIKTKTVPAMRKTDNPFFGKVFKITDANIQAGFHYINSVNNQLEREGKERNADLKERKWGVRIGGTPLVEHTNKKGDYSLYLEAKVESVNSSYFVDENGNKVDREDLAPFLYASKKSSTQENVEKEVFLRDYKLESIQWIKMDGVELGTEAVAEEVAA